MVSPLLHAVAYQWQFSAPSTDLNRGFDQLEACMLPGAASWRTHIVWRPFSKKGHCIAAFQLL